MVGGVMESSWFSSEPPESEDSDSESDTEGVEGGRRLYGLRLVAFDEAKYLEGMLVASNLAPPPYRLVGGRVLYSVKRDAVKRPLGTADILYGVLVVGQCLLRSCVAVMLGGKSCVVMLLFEEKSETVKGYI